MLRLRIVQQRPSMAALSSRSTDIWSVSMNGLPLRLRKAVPFDGGDLGA